MVGEEVVSVFGVGGRGKFGGFLGEERGEVFGEEEGTDGVDGEGLG